MIGRKREREDGERRRKGLGGLTRKRKKQDLKDISEDKKKRKRRENGKMERGGRD